MSSWDETRTAYDDETVTADGDAAARPAASSADELLPEPPARYRHVGHLGSGGMGRVELVEDHQLARRVALKEHGPGAATARFLREARITAQLEHPGIAPVYDIGLRANGHPYYTMRRIQGRTLTAALADCSTLDDRLRLLGAFSSMCQTLGYAHSKHVVHRDLKPDNVVLGEHGETVVIDWGLAKVPGDDDVVLRADREGPVVSDGDQPLTHVGAVMGTTAYMSPEQARGGSVDADARSDVWSLGVAMYELLTGRQAFEGRDTFEVLERVRHGRFASIEALCPEAPGELVAIAQRAMALEPDGRYPDGNAMAADVEAWRNGNRVGAYAYSRAEELQRLVRRYRNGLAAAGLVVGAMGVFTPWLAYERSVAEAERARAVEAEKGAVADSLLAKSTLATSEGHGSEALAFVRLALEWAPRRRDAAVRSMHIAPHAAQIVPIQEAPVIRGRRWHWSRTGRYFGWLDSRTGDLIADALPCTGAADLYSTETMRWSSDDEFFTLKKSPVSPIDYPPRIQWEAHDANLSPAICVVQARTGSSVQIDGAWASMAWLGRELAVSNPHGVAVYDPSTGARTRELPLPGCRIQASPKEDILAVYSCGASTFPNRLYWPPREQDHAHVGVVTFLSADTLKPLARVRPRYPHVKDISFFPSSQIVAIVSTIHDSEVFVARPPHVASDGYSGSPTTIERWSTSTWESASAVTTAIPHEDQGQTIEYYWNHSRDRWEKRLRSEMERSSLDQEGWSYQHSANWLEQTHPAPDPAVLLKAAPQTFGLWRGRLSNVVSLPEWPHYSHAEIDPQELRVAFIGNRKLRHQTLDFETVWLAPSWPGSRGLISEDGFRFEMASENVACRAKNGLVICINLTDGTLRVEPIPAHTAADLMAQAGDFNIGMAGGGDDGVVVRGKRLLVNSFLDAGSWTYHDLTTLASLHSWHDGSGPRFYSPQRHAGEYPVWASNISTGAGCFMQFPSGSGISELVVRDLETGRVISTLTDTDRPILDAVVLPDCKTVAYQNDAAEIRVWRLATSTSETLLRLNSNPYHDDARGPKPERGERASVRALFGDYILACSPDCQIVDVYRGATTYRFAQTLWGESGAAVAPAAVF